MIKFLASLLLAVPMIAGAKEINNVWLPFAGGNLETVCRTLWNTYDNYFGTSSVLFLKQGASGEIASKDMLDSSLPNRSVCAGGTMILYNKYLFPDIKTHGDELEMVVKVVNFPVVWYGPNRTPAVKNLDEYVTYLKSLKRPINVGVFQGPNRTVAQFLVKEYKLDVNVVMFKNGPQMYPSLNDGTLDLAFDSGAAVTVAEEGKFKVVGYTANGKISRVKRYVNFALNNKELAGIESWFGIAVPKNASPEFKETLGRRLEFVVRQEKFQTFADNAVSSADGLHGQKLQDDIKRQKSVVKKYWE